MEIQNVPEGLTDQGDGLSMDENGNIIQGRDLFTLTLTTVIIYWLKHNFG